MKREENSDFVIWRRIEKKATPICLTQKELFDAWRMQCDLNDWGYALDRLGDLNLVYGDEDFHGMTVAKVMEDDYLTKKIAEKMRLISDKYGLSDADALEEACEKEIPAYLKMIEEKGRMLPQTQELSRIGEKDKFMLILADAFPDAASDKKLCDHLYHTYTEGYHIHLFGNDLYEELSRSKQKYELQKRKELQAGKDESQEEEYE